MTITSIIHALLIGYIFGCFQTSYFLSIKSQYIAQKISLITECVCDPLVLVFISSIYKETSNNSKDASYTFMNTGVKTFKICLVGFTS